MQGPALDVALDRRDAGMKVALVSDASAYHVGGAVNTGDQHSSEEALCIQSTLLLSLKKARTLAQQLKHSKASASVNLPAWATPKLQNDGSPWQLHVPHDGCVLSPLVEVFRGGPEEGYPFEDCVKDLEAVISVSMPNCNKDLQDVPYDAHPDSVQYFEHIKAKWRAVVVAAAFYTKANCLVVSDVGCGSYLNPPDLVGKALGMVLREQHLKDRFKEVIVASIGPAGEAFASAMIKQ